MAAQKKKTTTTNTRKMITAEKFIKVWQKAKNISEVATKTGMTETYAGTMASKFRSQHNIQLKKFQRGPKKNAGTRMTGDFKVRSLRKLAKELA